VWRQRTANLRDNVKALRLRTVVSDEVVVTGGVSDHARTAAEVMRTGILPAIIVGLAFTALSVPLDEGGRHVGQYVATAAFVAAWGFARYGLWRNDEHWRTAAHRQTALWFGGFLIAAVILGALDEVRVPEQMPSDGEATALVRPALDH
jgi:hypothetical protein